MNEEDKDKLEDTTNRETIENTEKGVDQPIEPPPPTPTPQRMTTRSKSKSSSKPPTPSTKSPSKKPKQAKAPRPPTKKRKKKESDHQEEEKEGQQEESIEGAKEQTQGGDQLYSIAQSVLHTSDLLKCVDLNNFLGRADPNSVTLTMRDYLNYFEQKVKQDFSNSQGNIYKCTINLVDCLDPSCTKAQLIAIFKLWDLIFHFQCYMIANPESMNYPVIQNASRNLTGLLLNLLPGYKEEISANGTLASTNSIFAIWYFIYNADPRINQLKLDPLKGVQAIRENFLLENDMKTEEFIVMILERKNEKLKSITKTMCICELLRNMGLNGLCDFCISVIAMFSYVPQPEHYKKYLESSNYTIDPNTDHRELRAI